MGARHKKSKKPLGTRAELLLERSVFFTDCCLGKHVGQALRGVGLKVELHCDHFKEDEADTVWIPKVGAKGWIVLTKDKNIRRRPREIEAVTAGNVRMFTLPNANLTGQEMAERFVESRLRIARFLKKHQPPFVAVVLLDAVALAWSPEPLDTPSD